MVFLGCSFTFGHGLWHYTKEEGLPKDDICISPKDFPNAYTFMKNNRFSKIVSNHFGKFDIVKSHTAGCDEVSLEFLSEILGINTWQRKYTTDESFNFDQISHVIFQTSYLDRCALYENGKKVSLKDTIITEQRATELLSNSLKNLEQHVDSFCRDDINQNQFDALVSFAFNLGPYNLKSSTLLKKVNKNPNDPTIRDEFMRWTKAGGKVLKGLVERRQCEADLYFSK
jgi:lysozyme